MYFKNLNWPINAVVKAETIIDPKPPYQRGPVWKVAKKQLLIDSIINRFDIPKIYLRFTKGSGIFDYEVADGQQRLRAIWDFVKGEYPLGSVHKPSASWSGKFYSELSLSERKHIAAYKLTVTTVYDATSDQIRELFARLQKGDRLTPPELRNSMASAIGDVIRAMAETHLFFEKAPFSKARHKHDDLVSLAFALQLYAGSKDIKAPDLAEMYTDYKSAIGQNHVQRVNSALSYLAKVQKAGGNCIRTKWGFVDACWICLKHRSGLPDPKVFASRYIKFERTRLQHVAEPSALLAKGQNASDRELYDYIVAFSSSGGVKENLSIRQRVLLKRLI